jgi:hypothetical protein
VYVPAAVLTLDRFGAAPDSPEAPITRECSVDATTSTSASSAAIKELLHEPERIGARVQQAMYDMLLLRVNSKKPPHLCGKYAKPPLFGEIAKNHRFCKNSLQCALIMKLRLVNTISD